MTGEVRIDRNPGDRHGRAAGRDGAFPDQQPRSRGDPAAAAQLGGRPQGAGLARLSDRDASRHGDCAFHLLLARLAQFRPLPRRADGRALGGGPAPVRAGRSGDDPGGRDRGGAAQAARAGVRRPVDRRGLPDRQRISSVFRRPDRRRDGRKTRSAQLEGRAGGRLRPMPGPHSRHFPLRLDHRRGRRRRASSTTSRRDSRS